MKRFLLLVLVAMCPGHSFARSSCARMLESAILNVESKVRKSSENKLSLEATRFFGDNGWRMLRATVVRDPGRSHEIQGLIIANDQSGAAALERNLVFETPNTKIRQFIYPDQKEYQFIKTSFNEDKGIYQIESDDLSIRLRLFPDGVLSLLITSKQSQFGLPDFIMYPRN